MEVLDRPTTAIAEYSPTAAALAELRQRLSGVAYDLSTGKGLDIAKRDRAEVRGLRTALEAKRVELKAPALERSRLIDAEAKALTAQLVELETPIDQQIKAEEARKAAEKAAKEEAERKAAAAVQVRIDGIRNFMMLPAGTKSAAVKDAIEALAAVEVSLEAFGDRAGEVVQIKTQTLNNLNDMLDGALEFEAEQERIAAEKLELARQRAEQEARDKAERERVASEQKAAAAKLAAERAAFEKEQAAARAAVAAKEAKEREEREAIERIHRIERENIAAEQKKLDDAKRAEADRLAAIERKRLDDEAAERRRIAEAERVEAQRVEDEERRNRIAAEQAAARKAAKAAAKLAAAQKAGPRLLAALSALLHECTQDGVSERIDRAVSEEAYAAVEEGTAA